VFGEVTLDGRFGIVRGRLDGPTLLQVTRSGAVTFPQAGAILASLGLSVHRIAATANPDPHDNKSDKLSNLELTAASAKAGKRVRR
jgi:hypothetical protein